MHPPQAGSGPVPTGGEPDVRDNPGQDRFEIWVGEELAGFTAYRPDGDAVAFHHTVIEPAFEGRGLGSVLVRAALDAMRQQRRAVLPYCPFVRRVVERDADYLELVPESERGRFGLA